MTTVVEGQSPAPPDLPSWAPYVAAGLALTGLGAASLWTARHLAPDRALHDAALFAHLACLVVGFGAVLTVDWFALLWIAGRCELTQVLRQASMVHVPIWAGFIGLVLSGVLLEPDLASRITQTKLALVLLIGWNGLLAMWLHVRLSENQHRFRLSISMLSASISQVGWWGAMAIGFLNAG